MELSELKYPHLNRIAMLYPGPGMILGEELLWQPKWDGSNVRFYLDSEHNLCMGSRNLPLASPDMLATAAGIDGLLDNVKDLLEDTSNWGSEYVLFGELMSKGKSPTRIAHYDDARFVAFDLYTTKTGQFTPHIVLHQQCHHFNIECIEVEVITRHTQLDELYEYRDQMLNDHPEIEGFVIKSYNPSYSFGMLAVKEKHDTVKLDKIPRDIKDGAIQLPVLPDSEVYGAIDKVLADLGIEQFKDVKMAMPKVAKYVNEEARKHFNSMPRNIFEFYQRKLEDLTCYR